MTGVSREALEALSGALGMRLDWGPRAPGSSVGVVWGSRQVDLRAPGVLDDPVAVGFEVVASFLPCNSMNPAKRVLNEAAVLLGSQGTLMVWAFHSVDDGLSEVAIIDEDGLGSSSTALVCGGHTSGYNTRDSAMRLLAGGVRAVFHKYEGGDWSEVDPSVVLGKYLYW